MQLKELIFAGTGASGGLPIAACINRQDYTCSVCHSALTPEGAKNRRNNTSLIIIAEDEAGAIKNILIDCGKTFNASTLDCFLKNKIQRIDAVILTHGHADAMLGLDDLRPWCALAASFSIPVYLDQSTMGVVQSAFPYLVDTSKATGGGEVSALDFNIISHDVPFTVEGIEFVPLPVEHGFHADKTPFMSLGFRFGDVSYISDASRIPESTRRKMAGSKTMVLDCLRLLPYSSHFGIDQALDECAQIKPDHAFFVGMSHTLDHYEFEHLLQSKASDISSSLAPAYDGLKLSVTKTGEVVSFS